MTRTSKASANFSVATFPLPNPAAGTVPEGNFPLGSLSPGSFIGCDVGKIAIVVFDSRDGQTRTIPNRPDELAAYAATLDPTSLVVCEATGGHEVALLGAMIAAGIPAHRADARKVKAFIRSFGTLGKTDAIDARALARYGQERHAGLTRWQVPDTHRDQLQAFILTRRDLVDQRVAFGNRLTAPGGGHVQAYLNQVLECLNTQITALQDAIEALVRAHQPLNTAVSTIQRIIGIGAVVAASIIGLMPELGTLNRRQAAALAGLAPHPKQSGASDAYRRTKGGRPIIKKILFMAALSASKHNPTLKIFYERLVANGKKPLVAITAVMRKLIVLCNAMLRTQEITI